MSKRNLILVGLLLGNPRAFDDFTSGKACAELAQENVSDLTWTLATFVVSQFTEKSQTPLINNQHN